MKIIIGLIMFFVLTCNQSKELTQAEQKKTDTMHIEQDQKEEIDQEIESTQAEIKNENGNNKKPEQDLTGKRAEIVGQWKLEKISVTGRIRTETIPEEPTYVMFSAEGDYIEMGKHDATFHPKYTIHDELLGHPTLNISIGETGSPGILTIEGDTLVIDHGYYDGARYTYSRVKPQ